MQKEMENYIVSNISKDAPTYCCGCEVCVDICPAGAIEMLEDEEGFYYPSVDKKKCVNCGKCLKCCPEINVLNPINSYNIPISYGVKYKDEDIRMESRSGGVFTALSDVVLGKSGIIYGCGMTEEFVAKHFRAETVEERNVMRGSKYVQSRMKGICRQIIEDLKANRYVLFSGTSCQVQGIRNAVPEDLQSKLLLVDIVCHGVPSPKVWKKYLQSLEKKYKGKVTSVDFRNKKDYGWEEHVESIRVNEYQHDSKVYTNLFYNHIMLRPSCYHCPYKTKSHPGDITIADFWGIDKAIPGFNDNKGVSLVLVNNEKEAKIFEEAKTSLNWKKTDFEKCLQPPLKGNFEVPMRRKKFWKMYHNSDFDEVLEIYGKRLKPTLPDKVVRKIHRIIKKS